MKLYVLMMLHVDEQRWLDNYGCDQPVADDVVNYFTHEVIAGTRVVNQGLLRIADTFQSHAPGVAAEPWQGMSAVTVVAEVNVDRRKWAEEFALEDTPKVIADDVVGHFEHWVLGACSPVTLGLLRVDRVAGMTRPGKHKAAKQG